MKTDNNERIDRYQQIIRRKEEQLSDADLHIEELKKHLRSNETAVIINYRTELQRIRLREDIEELNQLIENLKTNRPLKLSPYDSPTPSVNKKNAHLTAGQRQLIQQGIAAGKSNSEIAREIGVHRSTVGREIKRYAQEREKYQAEEAQQLAKLNQRMAFSFREFKSMGMHLLTNLQRKNLTYTQRRHAPLRFDSLIGIRRSNISIYYYQNFGKYVPSGGMSDVAALFKCFDENIFSSTDSFPLNASGNDSTTCFDSQVPGFNDIQNLRDFSNPEKKNNSTATVRNQAEMKIFTSGRGILIAQNKSFEQKTILTIKPSEHTAKAFGHTGIISIKKAESSVIPNSKYQKRCA
jgi:predicted DNA-binding protein YlxM (UPF0122 family)